MFTKLKLKRQIKKLNKKIVETEHKRERSQAALVEAILTHTTPNDDDVDYFNKFTAEINDTRNEMHEAQQKLKNL